MQLDHFYTNEELETLLHQWESHYPQLVKLLQLGQSYEQKPIWLLIVSNHETGTDLEKPAVWIDANIHATEIAGTTTALRIAELLLSGYGIDARCTQLLDHSVYYIVPRLNPDGAALAMAKTPRYLRSGVRNYPWDEPDEGLHPQDIDLDGRILQMRLPDPNGDWKISSLDPRLMQKRAPEENGGNYYRLLPEGLFQDYDGYLLKIARPQQGLDFNRNFPFEWRSEGEQHGAGPFPASEAEIRAAIAFITSHPNINIGLSFHTFSRVILRPYSTKSDDDMETADLWVFKKMGEIGTRQTGYRAVSTFHDFKYHPKEVTTGAFDDWLFDHLGAYAFTIEQWDLPTEAGIPERKLIEWFREHPHEDDYKILQWVDQNAPGGFVPWYEFQHPQLGTIEMGGWNTMYTWGNPPPAFMEAEAERNAPYALTLGELLPHLNIHTLQIIPLSSGDYRLTLVVENTGYLPTFTSEQARKRSAVRPVRAELVLPEDVHIISGKTKVELGHLQGRSNKNGVFTVWDSSPTDNRAKTEWVLRAAPGAHITLRVLSERAGSCTREIVL